MQNQSKVVDHPFRERGDIELADLPTPSFSKAAVRRAGRLLAGRLAHGEGLPIPPDTVEAFRIAHDWRASHAYPMTIEKRRLTALANRLGGGLTAARLKRMSSVRKKLSRSNIKLADIQDLAGCRVILDGMAELRNFEAGYRALLGTRLYRETDYIETPKEGGYRSHHLMIHPRHAGERAVHNGQRMEVQLRTKLQHVWATAGEAAGAMRGEDLKAGEGSPEWLRLLELMAAEFAREEGQPLGPHVPHRRDRRIEELRALEAETNAIKAMAGYNKALKLNEARDASGARFFLIVMDTIKGTVKVTPKTSFGDAGYDEYGDASERVQTALVSVDGAKSLQAAYPNFFMDVSEFLRRLRAVLGVGPYVDRADLGFLSGRL